MAAYNLNHLPVGQLRDIPHRAGRIHQLRIRNREQNPATTGDARSIFSTPA
ncbi:hypothetical protein [Nonomuraea fuscirosea]|uniref:hypothetical protein n=1 Tax=Nonomuraea fuscirosea TaxID=1291556 RepID=UPI003444E3F5